MHNPYLEQVEHAIHKLVNDLFCLQRPDGSWNFCFESGTMTDSYMILLMQVLGENNEKIRQSIIERILNRQTGDGTWKLFADEIEGNLSATIESSIALMYAGNKDPTDPQMIKAREFIRSRGGVAKAGSYTKVMLSLFGHRKWSEQPRIPVEFFLLPLWFPINFFDFVSYSRVHIAPILLAADRSYSVRLPRKELVSNWLNPLLPSSQSSEPAPLEHVSIHEAVQSLYPHFRDRLHKKALQWGEQFLLQRIETDGTLYNYFSSTFLMIFALQALGYPKDHPVIQRAMHGLYSYYYELQSGGHIQLTTSTVWDTSLILHALQEAGVSDRNPVVKRGLRYILQRQHTVWGDWVIRNPCVLPGGWGFSDCNTIHPDVDDTTACLRALAPSVRHRKHWNAWKRGVDWVLSMQNRDGGWPAFEKNTYKAWTKLLPYEDGRSVWGDPSAADLTGRTLEFIGKELGWGLDHPVVRRACHWLSCHQRQDGSWYGRWGVSFIYGTWAALTGLAAVGVSRDHPMVKLGIRWLQLVQNPDGGWGESCYSDLEKRYVPLRASTPSQTAWALDALIAFHDQPTPQIQKGIERLLQLLDHEGWETTYPTGAGLPGQFYTHYHSYRYIWPLLTLARYRKKYGISNNKM
jgi:sporulenol synthase